MAGGVKILFVKDDLTTGLRSETTAASENPEAILRDLIGSSQPDAIVLDLTSVSSRIVGVEVIRTVRDLSALPLVVVSAGSAEDAVVYRFHGATDCVQAPVDIGAFALLMQELVQTSGAPVDNAAVQPVERTEPTGSVLADGVLFDLPGNSISGPVKKGVVLTTAEGRLLRTLARKPWCVMRRADLGAAIYGTQQPANDRAVDVLVNRLRKKLTLAGGEAARSLIKTEFRFGYAWAADAVLEVESAESQPRRANSEMFVPEQVARWATR